MIGRNPLTVVALLALAVLAVGIAGLASADHSVESEDGPNVTVTPMQYGSPGVDPLTLSFHVEAEDPQQIGEVRIHSPADYNLASDQPDPPDGYVRSTSEDANDRSWANFSAPERAFGSGPSQATFQVNYSSIVDNPTGLYAFALTTGPFLGDDGDQQRTLFPVTYLDDADPVLTRFATPTVNDGWITDRSLPFEASVDDQCPEPMTPDLEWHTCPTFQRLYVSPSQGSAQHHDVTDEDAIDLPDDADRYTLRLYPHDGAGNWGDPVETEIGLDPSPPDVDVSIDAGEEPWYTTPPTLEATCTEDPLESGCEGTQLVVDGTETGQTELTLADGIHEVHAHAQDVAGNENTTHPRTIQVDTVAPTLALAEPADGSFLADEQVTIAAEADDEHLAAVTCEIDGGPLVPCGPGAPDLVPDLEDGTHTVEAKAVDEAGNTATEEATFTLDRRAPELAVDRPEPGHVLDTTDIAVETTAEDPNLVAVVCRIDEGPAQDCRKDTTFADLAEGEHVLDVTAADEAGNTATLEHAFTIDLTPPSLAITRPSAGERLALEPLTVQAEATDATLESLECRVGESDWQPGCQEGVPFDVDEGPVTIEARASDQVGNEAHANLTATIDRTGPTIETVLDPEHVRVTRSVTAAIDARDPAGLATVDLRVDDRPIETVDPDPGTDAFVDNVTFETQTPGEHDVHVLAEDAVGNHAMHTASLQVDAGPVDTYEIDCPAQTPGNRSFTCQAQGFDEHGFANDTVPNWTVDGASLLATNDASVAIDPPEQGGSVHVQAEHAPTNATDTARVTVSDEAPPILGTIEAEVGQAGDPLAIHVNASDPGGIRQAWVTLDEHTLDRRDTDAQTRIEATLEPVIRTSGLHAVQVHVRDVAGHTSNRSINLTVEQAQTAGASYGSSPTATQASTSETTASPAPEDTVVSAEPSTTSDEVHQAQVSITSGRTPTVQTPEADLGVQLETDTHPDVRVEIRSQAARPAEIPGTSVRQFDVSARNTHGYDVEVDQAHVEVRLDEEDLAARGVEPGDVTLLHWTQQTWQEVDTDVIEAADGARLRAQVASLSPFAVTVPDEDTSEVDQRLELAREDESDGLPVTYRGAIDVHDAESPIEAHSREDAISLTLETPDTGEHEIAATIGDQPGQAHPDAVTDVGRYIDVAIHDADGQQVPVSPADLTVRLDTAQLPGDGSNLVPVTVQRDAWQPVSATLTERDGTVTVATQTPREPLQAVLADGEAPRVGLQEPLPQTVVGDHEVALVASDNLAVDRVRVLADGAVLGEDEDRPFGVTIEAANLAEGETQLRLEAVDAAGNVGEATRSVTVVAEEPLEQTGVDEPSSPEPNATIGSRSTPSPGLAFVILAAGLALGLRARLRP